MTSRLCVAAAAAMVVLGCQRGRDRAAEHLIEKAIETHGREARVEIDRAHGSVVVTLGGAIRPRGWPEPVPFYPRARRANVEQGTAGVHTLVLVCDDAPAVVSRFYRSELSSAGWELTSDADANGWNARLRGDTVRFRVSSRGTLGTRAEIEYRPRS